MISLVLYGRNDSYGYNLHKRAALSLNCMAEVLTDPEDEVLFVDYNTPDDYPTFPEAIADTLTERARAALRVLRVRPAVHMERFAPHTHLKALEPVSRNVAIRRSSPANRWILSTNTDMIFVPRAGISLTNAVSDLQQGFYCTPRFEIPETLWEDFDRFDAAGTVARVRALGEALHLNEVVLGSDVIRYDAPGDFQLIAREDLFRIHGFHEGMLRGWHVDSNISQRLRRLHGEVGDALPAVFAYHCDHTRQVTPAHAHGSVQNDPDRFVKDVSDPTVSEQADIWGLADLDIEEVSLRSGTSAVYLAALHKAIALPLEKPSVASYRAETYDSVPASAEHVLPFLMDLYASLPRHTELVWLGAHGPMLDLFRSCWSDMGFIRPPSVPATDEETAAALDAADEIVVNGGAPRLPAGDAFGGVVGALQRVLMVEKANNDAGRPLRRVVTINAIHNRLETILNAHVACAKTPFSTRLRHGYVMPATLNGPRDWSDGMQVGAAGTRGEDGAIHCDGAEGHVAYGPYRPLLPGQYVAVVAANLETGDAVLRLEAMADGRVLAAYLFTVPSGLHRLALPFAVPAEASGHPLEIAVHSAGGAVLQVAGVQVDTRDGAAGLPAEAAPTLTGLPMAGPVEGPEDWMAGMRPAAAGLRRGGTIEATGKTGHVCFGPYRRMLAGTYAARVDFTARVRLVARTRAEVVVEVVADDEVIARGDAEIAGRSRKVVLPFAIARDRAEVQIRVSNRSGAAFTVSAVRVDVAALQPG